MGRFGKSNKQTEHEYVEERLSPYLDGELLPEEQTVVQSHLASCEECQWNLETLRQTVLWAQELPAVPVPRMFTIPVPAEPVRAPRWRWSVPVFQAATALVAVLLFFAVAGDLAITNLMPASEAPSAVVWESAVVDVQMVETTVESEAMLAGEEGLPADIEEPVAAKEVEQVPAADVAATTLPTSAPQKVFATEPARIAAEIVSTPTTESSTMGGPELAPPPEQEQAKEVEAVAETDAAKPPPTTVSADAVATEALEASDEVAPSPAPLPTIMPTATIVQPTVVAAAVEGGAVGEDTVAEQEPTMTRQQPLVSWLGVAEVALAVVLVLLLTTTIILMLQRRRAS